MRVSRKKLYLCEKYVEIPPKYSVSEIMGYPRGKSSLMIFDRHESLKYKYGKELKSERFKTYVFENGLIEGAYKIMDDVLTLKQ